MSEIRKDNQNISSNMNSFDDEDDLWALQSDKEDTSLIDIDGFDDDNLEPLELPVSETKKPNQVVKEDDITVETPSQPQSTQPIETIESNSVSPPPPPLSSVSILNQNVVEEEIVSVVDNTTTTVEEQNKSTVEIINQEVDLVSPTTPEKEEIQPTIIESNDNQDDLISSLDEIESKLDNQPQPTIDSTTDFVSVIDDFSNTQKPQPEFIPVEKEVSDNLNSLVKNSLKELEEKRENLENTIAKLEKRKAKIEQEMTKNFAGVSQDLAIRVQGFKDYLVGSLQDLAAAAEQLELSSNNDYDNWNESDNQVNSPVTTQNESSSTPEFVEKNFTQEKKEIRRLLDQYRTRPDYYGPSWQLRRTFEPIHAKTVADWFFTQGGRGAISSMDSRLQNILVGSAIISILSHLYGDRSRILILADTPEKLGEWRRGLQDCLGISRSDFGPSRGVILFETPSGLAKKGDQIVEQRDLPFVIMDLDDDRVSLSLLKFPLWLAFAPKEYSSQSQGYY